MKPNLRCCVSCRRIADKKEMWRIVRVYPSHQVQLDQGLGRSAYICPVLSCVKAAQKKNRLGRTLKANVPSEIYETLTQRLGATQATEIQAPVSPPTVLSKTIAPKRPISQARYATLESADIDP